MDHRELENQGSSAGRAAGESVGRCTVLGLLALLGLGACAAVPDPARDRAVEQAQRTTGAGSRQDWKQAASAATASMERSGGEDPQAFADLGMALLSGQDLEGARRALDAGLARHPSDPGLLGLRGRLLVSMGFHRCAEVDLEKAVALDPTRVDLWISLGDARLALNLATGARTAYQQAVQRGSQAPEAYLGLARALDATAQESAAQQAYARSIELFDQQGGASNELMLEAAKQCADPDFPSDQPGAIQRARAWLGRVLIDDPQNVQANFLCGLLCQGAGELDGARRAFERAVEIDPAHKVALWQLGRVCQSNGETARAAQMYRRALDLEKDAQRRQELEQLLLSCNLPERILPR